MIEIIKTDAFDEWLEALKDRIGKAKIKTRIRRLSLGNPGNVEPVGDGVSELKIDFGPGYRVYFMQRGPIIVVLLCGGDKDSQRKDIAQAKAIAKQWKE